MTVTRTLKVTQQALALLLLQLMLAGTNPGISQEQSDVSKTELVDGFRVIKWVDLMPADDLSALLNPPDSVNDIPDGSAEDQIGSEIQLATKEEANNPYQQALVSTRIVPEFDGQRVRLPGFIVPVEFGDDQLITRFFLVPYFGACIHVPPPPPNQIVFADFDEGFKLSSLNDPFWLSGTLSTELIENDLATAAYTIKVDKIEPY